MRKVTYGGAASFDSFLARTDGAVDWLRWSDEAAALMNGYWPRVDTIVMGRKTWEIALQNAPAGGGDPYAGIKTFVFSRSLAAGERSGAVIVNDDPGKFVADLKAADGKEICVMGGGELAAALLDAGVIDEIGINIHPVLLGSGIPVFPARIKQVDLELVECRKLKHDCVYLHYRVSR